MIRYMLILLVMALAISACAAEDPAASLIGTWNLTSYGPAGSQTPAVADSDANLTFNEDGSVGGTSGCNSFGGQYTVEGNQVIFSEVVSTLMLCELLMEQEEAMLQVLTETATFEIEGNTLTLTNNDMVLVLTR